MTQMLLFDSPTSQTGSIVGFAASPTLESTSAPSKAEIIEPKAGVHHMGDLARLVLMRYDMVAARRAAILARKSEKGV